MQNNEKKKTLYDGIKISERGRDIIVFSLSMLLLIALIAAFVSAK